MPNKSDSAGKLHEYFTCKYLEEKIAGLKSKSPLDDDQLRQMHLDQFKSMELDSLKKIGVCSADEIMNIVNEQITEVANIGASSGASGFENTDDLEVTTFSGKKIGFSLKAAKASIRSQILSKNMGAKSLLSNYFNSPDLQERFNLFLDSELLNFLNSIFETNLLDVGCARKQIKQIALNDGFEKDRFENYPQSKVFRDRFLKSLRDELMSMAVNILDKDKAHACELVLDSNKHVIVADYTSGKERVKYKLSPRVTKDDVTGVKARGNDSMVIVTTNNEIGFRFKFESAITSSIKLVGDIKEIK